MKLFPLKSLLLLCAFTGSLCSAEPEEEVYASKFGFDPADATECLQKAIDSGARKVIVDNVGKPWIVRPLKLRSNLHMLFKKGVIVEAKANEFKDKNACLFSAKNIRKLVMEGEEGAVLRMRKKDYQNPKMNYSRSQWRNTIELIGCYDVTIRGLAIASSGGDGIYLGRSYGKDGRIACRDILIENCLIDDHHRQGISVISAINLIVRNCTISNTKGTEPEAGIDFEPNYPDEFISNCLVENCRFIDNHWSGINCSIFSVNPASVTIRNCSFKSKYAQPQLSFCLLEPFVKSGKGVVTIENCRLENTLGSAVTFMNFASDTNYQVVMRNVELVEHSPRKSQYIAPPPIRFTATSPKTTAMGGITFDNVSITGYRGVPIFTLGCMLGNKQVEKVSGSLIHNGEKLDAAALVSEDSALHRPSYRAPKNDFTAPPANETRKSSYSVPLRDEAEIVMWGDKGEKLSFEIEHLYFERSAPTKALGQIWKYMVIAPSGKVIALPEYAVQAKQPGATKAFSIQAEESGVYRLKLLTFPRINRILTSFHGAENLRWGIRGVPEREGVLSFRNQPGLKCRAEVEGFFEVPAGVSEFWIDSSCDSVTIWDPAGKEYRLPRVKNQQLRFKGKRGDSSKSEVWKLKASDFVGLQLLFSENLPGILAETPGNLPRVKTP